MPGYLIITLGVTVIVTVTAIIIRNLSVGELAYFIIRLAWLGVTVIATISKPAITPGYCDYCPISVHLAGLAGLLDNL